MSAVLADFAELATMPMKVFIPEYEFNDDDVYLYNVATKQLIRHYAISSHEVFCARYGGVKVREGQAWAKGRNARDLKLWRAV